MSIHVTIDEMIFLPSPLCLRDLVMVWLGTGREIRPWRYVTIVNGPRADIQNLKLSSRLPATEKWAKFASDTFITITTLSGIWNMIIEKKK
jgi:hypothetical protein